MSPERGPDVAWARSAAAGAVREALLSGLLGPLMDLHTRRRISGARRRGRRVQPVIGPGARTLGRQRAIIIDYLNGRLRLFVDTHLSVADIDDSVEGHLLAAERGRAGERYVLNSATIASHEALEIVGELSGIRDRGHRVPPVLARSAAAAAEGVARARGRTSSLCRARIRTILHGHRYDGSRATRELGLAYTPVAGTFGRTIDWAVAEGLITRPLPARPPGTRPEADARAGRDR